MTIKSVKEIKCRTQVFRLELMWTCLVCRIRTILGANEAHQFNSATGEQKGITQTIYTDSEPPSRLPNSVMPSAKLKSANLPFFYVFGVTRLGIEPQRPAPRAHARTTILREGGCGFIGVCTATLKFHLCEVCAYM